MGWAPTPLGPMCLGFGGNPKGGRPLACGASSLPPWPSPSRSHLEGPAPFPLLPINRGVEGGLQYHIQGAAPPLPNTSPPPRELGEALPENCHSITTTSSCCCWSFFLNLSLLLAGSRRRRRRCTVRVLNAEVLSVQHLVIGDSNHDEYDSIITIPLNASALDLQVVCRCKLFP